MSHSHPAPGATPRNVWSCRPSVRSVCHRSDRSCLTAHRTDAIDWFHRWDLRQTYVRWSLHHVVCGLPVLPGVPGQRLAQHRALPCSIAAPTRFRFVERLSHCNMVIDLLRFGSVYGYCPGKLSLPGQDAFDIRKTGCTLAMLLQIPSESEHLANETTSKLLVPATGRTYL